VKCPHCNRDIREAAVLKGAAAIAAKRRKKAGNQITPDEARAMQARSVAARRANRDASEAAAD